MELLEQIEERYIETNGVKLHTDFIPNIKIVWSEEAGHFIMADDPKIVISSIREFIQD